MEGEILLAAADITDTLSFTHLINEAYSAATVAEADLSFRRLQDVINKGEGRQKKPYTTETQYNKDTIPLFLQCSCLT